MMIPFKPTGVGSTDAPAHRRTRKRAPNFPGAELDRLILDLLRQDAVPRTAYQLLSALRDGGHALPVMSVYRRLDRLVARDMLQRVEALSAYRIRDISQSVLVICADCGRTTAVAVPDLHAALRRVVEDQDFDFADLVLEARGRCPTCLSEWAS